MFLLGIELFCDTCTVKTTVVSVALNLQVLLSAYHVHEFRLLAHTLAALHGRLADLALFSQLVEQVHWVLVHGSFCPVVFVLDCEVAVYQQVNAIRVLWNLVDGFSTLSSALAIGLQQMVHLEQHLFK